MDSAKIIAKGIDDKLVLKIPVGEYIWVKTSLAEYIESNQSFLQGAKVILDTGCNVLKSTELFELRDLLMDQQLSVAQVISEVESTRQAAEILGIRTNQETTRKIILENEVDTSIIGEQAEMVIRTLRSGNVVNSEGHLTVIGDVNPGACLRARGNILVWGKLRGEVHAGLSGDSGCVIFSLGLEPTSLSIAGISLTEGKRRPAKFPEEAFINKNTIKITPWKI